MTHGGSSMLTTGFFSAEARAAGDLTPDEAVVTALDMTIEFVQNKLHPTYDFGCFDLWPTLTSALHHLAAELEVNGVPEEGCASPWAEACEQGALLFLRAVLLQQRGFIGVPIFEWPHDIAQTCERFGEAYAAFAHTDLRVCNRPMYNIWVPVTDVDSEPLLLFAAGSEVADFVDWRAAQPRAHHLPIECAHRGEW